MVNVVADTLSTFASEEYKFSVAEVVEVGGSVDNSAQVVYGDGKSEDSSVVADDETADTTEHKVHAGVKGHLVLVGLYTNVLIIDDILGVEVLDTGIIGNIGDEEGVDLSS